MIYKKYQHIEKLLLSNGATPDEEILIETKGLLNGKVYVFPKIDGTNCCVFLDDNGNVCYGGRKQKLSIEDDNRGYVKYLSQFENKIKQLLSELPKRSIIYGEWLVPHTIKSYDKDAWKKFYIFDVVVYNKDIDEEVLKDNQKSRLYEYYIPYDYYSILLEQYDLDYVPVLDILENPSINDLPLLLEKNHYLLNDRIGEGIIVKNYDYKNPYGRRTWGKIVASDFHKKKDEVRTFNKEAKEEDLWTHKIVNKYLTPEFIQKEFIKYEENCGKFQIKDFSLLLAYIKEEFLKDNIVAISKEFKQGSLNFRNLSKEIGNSIKETLNL